MQTERIRKNPRIKIHSIKGKRWKSGLFNDESMMKWKKESKIIRLRCIKKINKGDDKINRDKKMIYAIWSWHHSDIK